MWLSCIRKTSFKTVGHNYLLAKINVNKSISQKHNADSFYKPFQVVRNNVLRLTLRSYRSLEMKIENSSISQKIEYRVKLFKMLLKTVEWKGIWEFCAIIICGLHLDRTLFYSFIFSKKVFHWELLNLKTITPQQPSSDGHNMSLYKLK